MSTKLMPVKWESIIIIIINNNKDLRVKDVLYTPELLPHRLMLFSVIKRSHGFYECLTTLQGIMSAYSKPCEFGSRHGEQA